MSEKEHVESLPRTKFSLRVFLALLGMMTIATLLSIFVFTKTSMRLDEAQSLFQTSRPLKDVYYLVAQDVHVPLYHTLLWFVTFFAGNNIVDARFMSLAFFLATIPAVYFLGKMVFGRRVGLFAAFIVTISPFMEWYGSEARMYSLLALMTVLHQIVFIKLFREGRAKHWVLYVILSILGIYSHYFFAFVLLTEAIFYLAYRKQFPKGSFKKFALTAFFTVAALAPWLLYVRSLGSADNTQPALSAPSSGDLFDTYAQFLFGFQSNTLNTIIVSMWPFVVLLAFFALQRSRKVPPTAIFFVLAATFPVLASFVFSIAVRPLYLSRYLIVALPALAILFAWILSIYPKKLRRTLQGVLTAGILVLLTIQIISPNIPVKEDYKSAVSYLEQNASSQDVIIATAPFTIYPIEYYYQGSAKLTTQPIWDRFNAGTIPSFDKKTVADQTKKNVDSYQRAWLVLSFDQGYNKDMKQYYDNHFTRLSVKQFSPKLVVYEYKIGYNKPVVIP